MNAAWSAACAPPLIAAFTAIACERARAYGCPLGLAKASARVTLSLTLAVCAWFALRCSGAPAVQVLLACSGACALSDVQTGYVFDRVLLAAAALMLPASIAGGHAAASVGGAILSGAVVLTPHACSRGRAIGLGDVKLAFAMGFALGPEGALRALWWAFVAGGAFALALLLARRARVADSLKFAPFLALGSACAAIGRY